MPQRLRLRLWLLRQHLTRGAFRLRRAQPSLWRRVVSRIVLARRARGSPFQEDGPRGVARVDGIRVINLRSRPDRLKDALAELRRLGIDRVERFDAVAHENRALGCSLSHAGCLQQMLDRGWDSMLVCEDDAQFLLDRRRLDVLIDAFLDDPEAEVACLAYFVWETR